MYFYNQASYNQPPPAQGMSWLEYTVLSNSQGVMLVLSKYGYIGWMAPQDISELLEASLDLIDRFGDRAVEDLLRAHPDFDIIRQVPGRNYTNFHSATGDGITEKLFSTIDRRIVFAAGVFLLAYILID